MSTKDLVGVAPDDQFKKEILEVLGNADVPEPVLEHSFHDPLFLHHLLQVKDSPPLLEKLIKELLDAKAPIPSRTRQPNLKEIAKATKSIISAAAFVSLRSSDADVKIRLDACYSCDKRIKAPNHGVYNISKNILGVDVCSLCGCHIEAKARLLKERCPSPDASNPGFNRWGQPIPLNRDSNGGSL